VKRGVKQAKGWQEGGVPEVLSLDGCETDKLRQLTQRRKDRDAPVHRGPWSFPRIGTGKDYRWFLASENNIAIVNQRVIVAGSGNGQNRKKGSLIIMSKEEALLRSRLNSCPARAMLVGVLLPAVASKTD
jgi:hypothetical protein